MLDVYAISARRMARAVSRIDCEPSFAAAIGAAMQWPRALLKYGWLKYDGSTLRRLTTVCRLTGVSSLRPVCAACENCQRKSTRKKFVGTFQYVAAKTSLLPTNSVDPRALSSDMHSALRSASHLCGIHIQRADSGPSLRFRK